MVSLKANFEKICCKKKSYTLNKLGIVFFTPWKVTYFIHVHIKKIAQLWLSCQKF